jgi:two-component system, LytTR family, response regulator LytT
MRAIIIEDEKLAADNLQALIHSIDKDIEIIARIESVRNAVKWLSVNTCDLIFLDIQLSDGNSFTIFEQIEVKTPIIFTTAYDQYAIKAFKQNSIDYLLKPINKDELEISIEKFKELRNSSHLPDLKLLIESIKKPVQYQERFLVSAGMKLKTIKAKDVAYFYVKESGVFLCSRENKHYDIDFTLDKLEKILDPDIFFRINRQYIVHIDAIENMVTVSKSRLQLNLNPKATDDIIVSVNNVHDFRMWLNR